MAELYDVIKNALVPVKIADTLCSAQEFLPIRYQYDCRIPDRFQNDPDSPVSVQAERSHHDQTTFPVSIQPDRYLHLVGGGPVDKSTPFAVSILPFDGLFLLESLRGGGQLTLDEPNPSTQRNKWPTLNKPVSSLHSERKLLQTPGQAADGSVRIIKDGDILISGGSAPCRLQSMLLPWSFRLFFIAGPDLPCFLPFLDTFYMAEKTEAPTIASAVEKLGAFPAGIGAVSLIRMHSLLTQILSDVCLSVLPQDPVPSENIPAYLRDMHAYIHNLQNLSFSLADQEALYGISRYRLCREYSAAFSISPLKEFNLVRIEEAKKLLLNTNLQVQEISSRIGYENINHFIRLFKAETGMTPGAFRSAHIPV